MKKSTVRFASVVVVLVMGALAIALAQHDSRQRQREAQVPIKQFNAEPEVISVPELAPAWGPASRTNGGELTVRGNDDGAPLISQQAASSSRTKSIAKLPPENPLRGGEVESADAEVGSSTEGVKPADYTPSNLAGLEGVSTASTQVTSTWPSTAGQAGDNAPMAMPPLPTLSAPTTSSSAANTAPIGSNQAAGGSPAAAASAGLIAPPSLSLPSLPTTSAVSPAGTASSSNNQSGAMPLPTTNTPMGTGSNAAASANTNVANAVLGGATPLPRDSQPPASLPSSSMAGASSVPAVRSDRPGWVTEPPARSGSAIASSGLSDTQRAPMAPTALVPPTNNLPSTSPASTTGAQANAPGAWLNAPTALPGSAASSPPNLNAQNAQVPNASSPNANSFGNGSAMGAGRPTSLVNTPPNSNAAWPTSGSMASGNSAPARSSLTSTRSPLADNSLVASLVSKQPGNRYLDGSQNPIMLIQKRAPEEIQVGKRAMFVITVRNAGNTTAHDVTVVDSVPEKTSFAEAMPETQPNAEGILTWKLGEMGPGDERTINVQIVPESQGEIGSVATVHFAAQASVRTVATSPKLEITQTAMPDVLIGDVYSIEVVVKNIGTGVAKGVRLEADLPAQFKHESGDSHLEAVFGNLAPSESKRIRLDCRAVEPGVANSLIRGLTEDGLQQEIPVPTKVLAPQVALQVAGPARRFVDRQATFTILVQNTGTATATNCEIMVRLPAGLNFNSANNKGEYVAADHAVYWSLPELPAGKSGTIELVVLPVQAGVQALTSSAVADLGVKAESRAEMMVEEQGELSFSIQEDADPIEATASTTYTVEVRNVGMRSDRDVRLAVQLPPGSQVLKVDAPTNYNVRGDQLVFDPIPQMDARNSQSFRFEVKHAQAGIQVVRAQLSSQNRPSPVVKEESTEVYDDRR